MDITGTMEWDDVEDRTIWRQFLETRTGRRLIPKVLESCPALSGGGDTNSILIRNGEVRGVQLIVQSLLALSQAETPALTTDTPSAYPRLDDDSKWADGKKVNEP